VATSPDAATIEAIIDAAFWASLRREENYAPKISLASRRRTRRGIRCVRPADPLIPAS